MRVVIVNTFDTEAVLQDFLQTVRAWEAGRPDVHIKISVDAPTLSTRDALAILRGLDPPLQHLKVMTRPGQPAWPEEHANDGP